MDLDELRELIRTSVGVEEGVDLNGDIAEVEFAELGYDSLALLELAAQLQRRYGLFIPDDAALEMTTPGKALRLINEQVAKAGG